MRSLTVHAGHKVGLVGAERCGKSSLFALIRGELAPDAGDIELPPRWTIAHVAQETPAVERAAIDFVLDGDRELREIERRSPWRRGRRRRATLAELHHRYEAIGGYGARARAATLLAGLGFTEAQHGEPVDERSPAAGACASISRRR